MTSCLLPGVKRKDKGQQLVDSTKEKIAKIAEIGKLLKIKRQYILK